MAAVFECLLLVVIVTAMVRALLIAILDREIGGVFLFVCSSSLCQ